MQSGPASEKRFLIPTEFLVDKLKSPILTAGGNWFISVKNRFIFQSESTCPWMGLWGEQSKWDLFYFESILEKLREEN